MGPRSAQWNEGGRDAYILTFGLTNSKEHACARLRYLQAYTLKSHQSRVLLISRVEDEMVVCNLQQDGDGGTAFTMPKSAPLELQSLASTSTSNNVKNQRRAHIPASVLKAIKVAAGDFIILRPVLTADALAGVKIDGESEKKRQQQNQQQVWLLAVAWPSFSQDSGE